MAVYGIDLGTTYSCIARFDGRGEPEDLKIADNSSSTPSVVTFLDTGKPIVGATAKNYMRTKPDRTKAFVKREMDKEFCEGFINVGGTKRRISPIEVQACILKHLLTEANRLETGAGRPAITKAVITVPAKFDEIQRARTMEAAKLAGIEVLGLLQEPTAAAVSYNIPAGNTALVFDLGGGTLDVSIVVNQGGTYNVLGIPTGDPKLGGIDWDEVLLRYALRSVGKDEPQGTKWNKLMSKAEECKKLLSGSDTEFELSDNETAEISVNDFENSSIGLINKCLNLVETAIANARRENPDLNIDFFLTVGGSSKMPMIKKALMRKYGPIYGRGKTENQWMRISDPDTAIAKGAAKYAYMLENGGGDGRHRQQLQAIADKATHSYGIKIRDRDGRIIIRNLILSSEPIVCSNHNEFVLTKEASTVTLEIYEDSSSQERTELNNGERLIITQKINFGKTFHKGSPISINIERDANGMIHLTLNCNDFNKTIDVNCGSELLDKDTRETIIHSLSLMR